MRNITCDNNINNKECRSKTSLDSSFSVIPTDWVELRILISRATTTAKMFCPKCADTLSIDKKTLSEIKSVNKESNIETVLYDIIKEIVQESIENTPQ